MKSGTDYEVIYNNGAMTGVGSLEIRALGGDFVEGESAVRVVKTKGRKNSTLVYILVFGAVMLVFFYWVFVLLAQYE